MAFDDILKYINDLSMSIPLKESLQHAEYVYFQLVRLSEQQPEVAAVLAGLEPSATALATETAANAIRAHATTSGPATASSVAAPGRPPPASSACESAAIAGSVIMSPRGTALLFYNLYSLPRASANVDSTHPIPSVSCPSYRRALISASSSP